MVAISALAAAQGAAAAVSQAALARRGAAAARRGLRHLAGPGGAHGPACGCTTCGPAPVAHAGGCQCVRCDRPRTAAAGGARRGYAAAATGNRGVIFMGPNHVEVQPIPFPKLELDSTSSPVASERQKRKCNQGVILKVTTTNICGSDQHMVR